jgi:hypothetical protein
MILALLIFDTTFWLYIASKTPAAMAAHMRKEHNNI